MGENEAITDFKRCGESEKSLYYTDNCQLSIDIAENLHIVP